MTQPAPHPLPYRRGVGIVVFNAHGLTLMGERRDSPGAWQWPQGGIDGEEDPWAAAQRELWEETGIRADKIRKLGEHPDWLRYDFPAGISGHPIYGRHAGQIQKWFAVRFLGSDDDILLEAHAEPEFAQCQWFSLTQAAGQIISFKKGLYQTIARDFNGYIGQAAVEGSSS